MAYKNIQDRIGYDKEYYQKNKERKEKYRKEHYLKNRDIILKKMRDKYVPSKRVLKTEEEKKERDRLWRIVNRERINEKARQWKERHRDWLKQYHKGYQVKYYLKNKDNIDLKNKTYGKTHRKEMVKNVQRYVSKNKEKVGIYLKKYSNTFDGMFRITKSCAKRKNRVFNLLIQDFKEIVSKPCIYCGEAKKKIGVDRINNSIGYTKENSAPCCKNCNYMKRNLTKEEFLLHIKKIYKYNLCRQ